MNIETYAKFDSIQREIKALLQRAKSSVHICVAWMSLDIFKSDIDSMLDRGVKVHLILNHDDKNSIDGFNQISGLNFKPLMMRVRGKIMHNKFCIIDEKTVITGSYNWSANAEQHFENILVIENDFPLVKSFLHEFHDLADYHSQEVEFAKCICGSNKFTLAIFGYEQGKYRDSTVGYWSVCAKNRHIEPLGHRDEQFLYARLDLDDKNDDFEMGVDEYSSTVEGMRYAFKTERNYRNLIQSYFDKVYGRAVHGIGWVVCTNVGAYYHGYEDAPEYAVLIPFRNAYARKLVPHLLEEYEGEVDSIIDAHKPTI